MHRSKHHTAAALAFALVLAWHFGTSTRPPGPPHLVGEGQAAASLKSLTGSLNVRSYGAKGDGTTDDTAAFQAALTAMGAAGGGVVLAPPGVYNLAGVASAPLVFPLNTSLVGSYRGPNSHTGYRDGPPRAVAGGTRLNMPTGGSVAAYLILTDNCTIEGMSMYAPAQTQTTSPPLVSPPWISMTGENATVRYVELLNPYHGIDANASAGVPCERPTIEHVTGQPLYIGISMGNLGSSGISDCGRITDVHFNPWFCYPQNLITNPALYNWQQANGTAFLLGDCDEFIAKGNFCFGYAKGLHFVSVGRGAYGSWVGGGLDACGLPILIEGSQIRFGGLRIADLGISPELNSAPVGVTITGTCGQIYLTNIGAWGYGVPASPSMVPMVFNPANGSKVTMTGCHWIGQTGAIQVLSGIADLSHNDFPQAVPMIAASGSAQVLAVGNTCKGGPQFAASGSATIAQANNLTY